MENFKVTKLISESEIKDKVAELGRLIDNDYAGQDIILICTLKGAVIFTADLSREIRRANVEIDFMDIFSYGDGTTSNSVEIRKVPKSPIYGKDVIIIEDIIDTGKSLSYTVKYLLEQHPNSLKVCSLLDKPSRRTEFDIKPDYTGFVIPDKFVVGYGMDYAQKFRNLPYIGFVDFEV